MIEERDRRLERALVALLLIAVFVSGIFPLWDFDFWGHLAAARYILDHHTVPAVDPFAWNEPGRPWVDLYWLFQLGLYGLYKLGGSTLIITIKALLGTAAIALVLAARGRDVTLGLAATLAVIPSIAFGGRFYERPELLSLLMIAAFLAMLSERRAANRSVWVLPLLQLLWVNIHPFFIFGLLIVTLAAIEKRLRWTVVAACAAACLLNPYGWRGALFPFQVLTGQVGDPLYYRRFIGELRPVWQFLPWGWSSPYLLAFLFSFALGLAALLGALAVRRASLLRAVLFTLFAMLGWSATRNVALFSLIVAYTAPADLAALIAWQRERNRPSSRAERKRAAGAERSGFSLDAVWRPIALGVAMLLTLGYSSGLFYDWAGEGRRFGWGERAAWFPHDAASALAAPGSPQRAFVAQFGIANLVLFHDPGKQVFIDPRLEVNSRASFDAHLELLAAMAAGNAAGLSTLQRNGEWAAVLLDKRTLEQPIEGMRRIGGWRIAYEDPLAVLFLHD